MLVAAHLRKIEKLQRLRERLEPLRDFELWFWATMSAGTHALNAALHRTGATLATNAFAMQPGLYLVPTEGGTLEPRFAPLGDVLHVGRPAVEAAVPAEVDRLMHAMERIEQYRDPCVREGRVPDAAIVGDCEEAFAHCLASLDSVMEMRHGA
jgi:hypothetical protein